MGVNKGPDDGLVYTCNQHILDFLADYHIGVNASIKPVQAGFGLPQTNNEPTGNIFSDFGKTVLNEGAALNYLYYSQDPLQNPSVGAGFSGITVTSTPNINQTCSDPIISCDPCSEVLLQAMKSSFSQSLTVVLT